MSQGAFEAFKSRTGLIDKAAERVCYLIGHDPIFKAWCKGRVVRSRTFGPVDGLAIPHVAVSAVSIRSEFRPSQEVVCLVPIAITFVWNELVTVHEKAEPSVASAVEHAHEVLFRKPYLDLAEFDGDRITERLDNFEPVGLAVRQAEGSPEATFALTTEAVYEISRDTVTWERWSRTSGT